MMEIISFVIFLIFSVGCLILILFPIFYYINKAKNDKESTKKLEKYFEEKRLKYGQNYKGDK